MLEPDSVIPTSGPIRFRIQYASPAHDFFLSLAIGM
jgi:hypothetical protein